MNIKRAFLTAVALLAVPGFALAQTTVRFDTSLELVPHSDDYTQTITVELTCNTGNPLVQDFEIGPTTEDKVIFTVENFDLEKFISCEVVPSSLTGFEVVRVETNGDWTDDDTCLWTADEKNLSTKEDNYCRFVMAPKTFEYVVAKEWVYNVDSDEYDISEKAKIRWTCENVLTSTLPYDDELTTAYGKFTLYGDDDDSVTTLRPNPWADADDKDATTCYAEEKVYDSAVESDGACNEDNGPTTFVVGEDSKTCTITNTVFFEGIPTLSQYGLAVMALLMLGVGFVGFRRFV